MNYNIDTIPTMGYNLPHRQHPNTTQNLVVR